MATGLAGLSDLWESMVSIRNRINRNGQLLLWLSDDAVGLPSLKAAGVNRDVLLCFINTWCPHNPLGSLPNGRVGPPLGDIEKEAYMCNHVHTFFQVSKANMTNSCFCFGLARR